MQHAKTPKGSILPTAKCHMVMGMTDPLEILIRVEKELQRRKDPKLEYYRDQLENALGQKIDKRILDNLVQKAEKALSS
jgi:hypothetical protein